MYRKIKLDDRHVITLSERIVSLKDIVNERLLGWYHVPRQEFYAVDSVRIPPKILTAFKLFALREKIKV
jgi:hypothetical protein